MYVEARGRSGQDRFVTQICQAGGMWGAVSPPAGSGAEPRNQAHFFGKHEITYFNNDIVL